MAKRKKSHWTQRDPWFERERARYPQPIPSREWIRELLVEAGRPLNLDDLMAEIGLEAELEPWLARRLDAMVREGQVVRNRRGAYCEVGQGHLIRGRVIAHADGFGFVVPDEGGDDLFLSPREMRALFHGDRVLVRLAGYDRRGRPEGAVVEVLARALATVVGRFHQQAGVAYVAPDNPRIRHDILIPPADVGAARVGHIVEVALVEMPTRRTPPVGRVLAVLGEHMDPGLEIEIAIRSHGLPHQWSPEARDEADVLPSAVRPEDCNGRTDLRGLPLVTIDGPDAKDFDDAVYAEPRDDGWKLVVAIADVSHYVQTDSALDLDARERGTSVYFPGRVVPMLPEKLSNGLCSLNPGVDRLCIACEMTVDREGHVRRSRFMEAVMHSHARLTYDTAKAIVIDRDADARARHAALLPSLDALHDLYRALLAERQQRGAIDFDAPETRIVFGPDKKIERIEPVVRHDAHRLIEECMIAANVAAARFLRRHKVPLLYRVHEPPPEEKVTDLRTFLGEIGLSLRGGAQPEAGHYAALVDAIRGRPDARLIQSVLLRSLSQAVYTPEHGGHFGLALGDYAHFTSPIRRYPDLMVHRGIRRVLRSAPEAPFPVGQDGWVVLGEHCSMTERRADEATRDATAWLQCEYMADRVGEVFSGIISAVTSFGLFVHMTDVSTEGLVHVTALPDDYYQFDPVHHRLVGERMRRVFRLGDAVEVRVARVQLDERKIDLELCAGPERRKPGNKRRK